MDKSQLKLAETTPDGQLKSQRYKWREINPCSGELKWINKELLHVDSIYQRTDQVSAGKVAELAANFNWIAFGVLLIAQRRDESLWIYDGMHRWFAALKRSEVTQLPCIVFKFDSIASEARAFESVNQNRKVIPALSVHKARMAYGEELTVFTVNTLAEFGMKFTSTAAKFGDVKCVSACIDLAKKNKETFRLVVSLAADLCKADDMELQKILIEGLFFIHHRIEGLLDATLVERIRNVGAVSLCAGIHREEIRVNMRGDEVSAQGIINEINKLGRKKFTLKADNSKQK